MGRLWLFFQAANMGDQRGLIGLFTVAHVDPKRVGACQKQLFDHFGRVAGWTQGGKNADFTATRLGILGQKRLRFIVG